MKDYNEKERKLFLKDLKAYGEKDETELLWWLLAVVMGVLLVYLVLFVGPDLM